MSDKKQSSVDFIFNAFNLLSDSDFKAWMLNNHGVIKAMHREETEHYGAKCCMMTFQKNQWSLEQLYNETFGGNNE